MDDGELPIDPRDEVEGLSPLDRAIWSEKMRGASTLEIALKLYVYEDVVRGHLQTISRKLGHVPSPLVKARSGNGREPEKRDRGALAAT